MHFDLHASMSSQVDCIIDIGHAHSCIVFLYDEFHVISPTTFAHLSNILAIDCYMIVVLGFQIHRVASSNDAATSFIEPKLLELTFFFIPVAPDGGANALPHLEELACVCSDINSFSSNDCIWPMRICITTRRRRNGWVDAFNDESSLTVKLIPTSLNCGTLNTDMHGSVSPEEVLVIFTDHISSICFRFNVERSLYATREWWQHTIPRSLPSARIDISPARLCTWIHFSPPAGLCMLFSE
mmetsp:Transcript_131771/g.262951  ORF Transcript_131771/g.262951 Transcript_131771/m.262951 type:complete len:241 (+) Transcript_131771:164-886(+)